MDSFEKFVVDGIDGLKKERKKLNARLREIKAEIDFRQKMLREYKAEHKAENKPVSAEKKSTVRFKRGELDSIIFPIMRGTGVPMTANQIADVYVGSNPDLEQSSDVIRASFASCLSDRFLNGVMDRTGKRGAYRYMLKDENGNGESVIDDEFVNPHNLFG